MGISLLATTSSAVQAVLLMFSLYLLNLLVPIIPAVIIYRLFPEGKTSGAQAAGNSIEGSVAGWKIKAVGAWGAYVTAFVLGVWILKSLAVPLIKNVAGESVWTIDSVDFQLIDEKEKPITNATLDESLRVDSPMVSSDGQHANYLKFISNTVDPPGTIYVSMNGYEQRKVVLIGVPVHDGKFALSTPITLKRLPSLEASPPPTGTLGSGVPATVAGPPPVTSTH
jgi:hypothetical protein